MSWLRCDHHMYDSVEPVAKSGFRKTFKSNIQQGTIGKVKNYVLVWIKLPIFRCFGEEKVLYKSKERYQSLERISLSNCAQNYYCMNT